MLGTRSRQPGRLSGDVRQDPQPRIPRQPCHAPLGIIPYLLIAPSLLFLLAAVPGAAGADDCARLPGRWRLVERQLHPDDATTSISAMR